MRKVNKSLFSDIKKAVKQEFQEIYGLQNIRAKIVRKEDCIIATYIYRDICRNTEYGMWKKVGYPLSKHEDFIVLYSWVSVIYSFKYDYIRFRHGSGRLAKKMKESKNCHGVVNQELIWYYRKDISNKYDNLLVTNRGIQKDFGTYSIINHMSQIERFRHGLSHEFGNTLKEICYPKLAKWYKEIFRLKDFSSNYLNKFNSKEEFFKAYYGEEAGCLSNLRDEQISQIVFSYTKPMIKAIASYLSKTSDPAEKYERLNKLFEASRRTPTLDGDYAKYIGLIQDFIYEHNGKKLQKRYMPYFNGKTIEESFDAYLDIPFKKECLVLANIARRANFYLGKKIEAEGMEIITSAREIYLVLKQNLSCFWKGAEIVIVKRGNKYYFYEIKRSVEHYNYCETYDNVGCSIYFEKSILCLLSYTIIDFHDKINFPTVFEITEEDRKGWSLKCNETHFCKNSIETVEMLNSLFRV
jgi:hypothetical protein